MCVQRPGKGFLVHDFVPYFLDTGSLAEHEARFFLWDFLQTMNLVFPNRYRTVSSYVRFEGLYLLSNQLFHQDCWIFMHRINCVCFY